jgi:hypothetical protein
MIEAGDGSENFALSALAGTRRAEQKKRFINHDQATYARNASLCNPKRPLAAQ